MAHKAYLLANLSRKRFCFSFSPFTWSWRKKDLLTFYLPQRNNGCILLVKILVKLSIIDFFLILRIKLRMVILIYCVNLVNRKLKVIQEFFKNGRKCLLWRNLFSAFFFFNLCKFSVIFSLSFPSGIFIMWIFEHLMLPQKPLLLIIVLH